MSTLQMDEIYRYNEDEIREIIDSEATDYQDVSFLTALSTFGGVADLGEGEARFGWVKPVAVLVIETTDYQTGIFKQHGALPILVLNIDQVVMDYDFISAVHTTTEADIYIWSAVPWSDVTSDLGVYGEWYRRDVYKDGMKPFEGTQTWEDLPPTSYDE